MKFIMAFLAWIVMGGILGTALWSFTVKGNAWPLAISAAAFVFAVGKIGCATH